MRDWTPPSFEEVCMNAEIGAYQSEVLVGTPAPDEGVLSPAPPPPETRVETIPRGPELAA